MTIHAAKGLEVQMRIHCRHGRTAFPVALCRNSTRNGRRTAIVLRGHHSAEENCFISYSKSRFRNGQTNFANPSRFLKDIDRKFLEYNDEVSTTTDKKMRSSTGGTMRWKLNVTGSGRIPSDPLHPNR